MEPVNIKQLIRRRKRKQSGQYRETDSAFFIRFYRHGKRVEVKVADKSPQYQTRADVEHLITKLLAGDAAPDLSTVTGYVELRYMPWVRENKAASTAYGYEKLWRRWKPAIGSRALATLQTSEVSTVLTTLAQEKPKPMGASALGHMKWFLSGVYEHALKTGVATNNPVPSAGPLCRVARKKKQPEYSLQDIQKMLAVLEPIDIRAAVAVALAYFAALRPAEIRGLQWADYDGTKLQIRRSYWRDTVGETKTAESANSVPLVIEPLRGLLERLRALTGAQGYILQNEHHRPLSLDSLNVRVIAPVLKASGIPWFGYYPCRRGISSLITDSSKNALNSTGLLRHSTPVTALSFYTRAQADSIRAALETVEALAEAQTKDETRPI
jgi:integrase